MRLVNLTPHTIRLARSPDPASWVAIPSSGRATVTTQPGEAVHVEGCPVPVVGAPTYGEITGLPESCEEGDLLIVSFPVAARAALEIIETEHLLEAFREDPTVAQAAIDAYARRLSVLRCVVQLGTGPADGAIRWTEADLASGLCERASVGQPRAVTRLIRPA